MEERISLNARPLPRRITAVRRFFSAIALSAVLSFPVAPTLAAACCKTATSHACCAKSGSGTATTASRAPCCRASPATGAQRSEAMLGTASGVVMPVAVVLNEAAGSAQSSALAAPPHRSSGPRPQALGPPLRLRI